MYALSWAQRQRVERAAHNITLIDHAEDDEGDTWIVQGSTGSYKVQIDIEGRITCDCPDSQTRCVHANCICKHCCFVCLHVLGMDPSALPAHPPHCIFTSALPRPVPEPRNDECTICFDTLQERSLVVCEHCRNALHTQCYSRWRKRTCPSCRQSMRA